MRHPGRSLAAHLEVTAAVERRRATRLLLGHPLITPDGPDSDGFALVRKHADELVSFFAAQLGYRLFVEPDLARLHKTSPFDFGSVRSLLTRSGQPFDPRRYSLLCLALAVLERVESQISLSQLADGIQLLAASDDGLAGFDPDRYHERRGFVHAVQAIADLGAIILRDGDEEAFARGGGDALYDVNPRLIAQLLVAAVRPSTANNPEALSPNPYPDTDEGRARRARHSLMRRLVEEPVVYLDDLTEQELSYLRGQRHTMIRNLEEWCGFEVEVRAEGIACIDPDESVTDLRFPSHGTVAHAALLLSEVLTEHARAHPADGLVARPEIADIVEHLVTEHQAHWRADVTEKDGPKRLAEEAIEYLGAFSLVRTNGSGVTARPALARFRTTPARDKSEGVDGL
ncbi:MAG TPA: TIGR02678 family protein [Actinomycetota bacterium]|nr:TIGR02678 family protein [Actinomycetota bacterium]